MRAKLRWAAVACVGLSSPARVHATPLRFKNGLFKVVQLTDLHLGEGEASNTATRQAVARIVASEPDAQLIVLSGDMVSSFRNRYSRPGWFEEQYMLMMSALDISAAPHAAILGNHDAEAVMTRAAVIAFDAALPSSLTPTPDKVSGTPESGNYWLDVLSEVHVAPALRLWFLDTMNRGCGGVPGWGCVKPQTVDWIRRQLPALPAVPTAAVFAHIPFPEFIPAWNRGSDVRGVKGEFTCCPSCNSGALPVLRKDSVSAVYSGHDHDNDFVTHWRGVRFAYGRKAGHGSYGPSGRLRGARVIVFREGEQAAVSETYIRQEDGSALIQPLAARPFWQRWQWACEAGIAVWKIFKGDWSVRLLPGLDVRNSHLFGCSVRTEEGARDL